MKSKYLRIGLLSAAAGGLALVSGCAVDQNGHMVFAAPVVVAPQPVYVAPAPVYVAPQPVVVEEPVMVPETYVWDGYENVGVVNGQYFYLGAGNVWLVAEPFRLERFHGWERYHPDWRDHAIRNDRFRRDAHGHEQPMRDNHNGHGQPERAAPDKKKQDEH